MRITARFDIADHYAYEIAASLCVCVCVPAIIRVSLSRRVRYLRRETARLSLSSEQCSRVRMVYACERDGDIPADARTILAFRNVSTRARRGNFVSFIWTNLARKIAHAGGEPRNSYFLPLESQTGPGPGHFEFPRIIREMTQASRRRVIESKITGSSLLTCFARRPPPVWSRFTSQCSKSARARTPSREYKLVCLHERESPRVRPSASLLVNNFSFTARRLRPFC